MTLPAHLYDHDAVISNCGTYRYWLKRTLDESNLRNALFVMLNPSTADATLDDPTIRRLKHFTRAMGCGRFGVVNLFAFRSSSPAALLKGDDPVGPLNADAIERAAIWAHVRVAAWGAPPSGPKWFKALYDEQVGLVIARLMERSEGVHCLGETQQGAPRHPLYLKNDAALRPWSLAA